MLVTINNYQCNLCFELCCKLVHVLIQYFVNLCVPKLYVGCPPLLFATYLCVRSRPIYEPGCWISHDNGGAKLYLVDFDAFDTVWYRFPYDEIVRRVFNDYVGPPNIWWWTAWMFSFIWYHHCLCFAHNVILKAALSLTRTCWVQHKTSLSESHGVKCLWNYRMKV